MTGRMEGKKALVTGAASGMGQAVAERFLKEGASVAAVDMNEEALTSAVKDLENLGPVVGIRADIARSEDVTNAVEKAVEAFGGLDTVVNVAGILDNNATLETTDEALWDKVLNVNLKGAFLMCKAAMPHLEKNDDSAIVNIGSIAGISANGGGLPYTVSKHGLMGLNKKLAAMHGPNGVRVNAILPGAVETGMTREMFATQKELMEQRIQAVPARRFAQADELANAVLYLASEEAGFVMGAALVVDGGWTL